MFFQRFDEVSDNKSHVLTGPTGTNVMDLQIMLLEKRGEPVKERANKGARS